MRKPQHACAAGLLPICEDAFLLQLLHHLLKAAQSLGIAEKQVGNFL